MNHDIRFLAYAVLMAGGAMTLSISENANLSGTSGSAIGGIILIIGFIGFIRRLIIDRRNDRQNQRPDGGTP